jgi:Carboxypeptidase regulatory-like domain/TonB dependent receptor
MRRMMQLFSAVSLMLLLTVNAGAQSAATAELHVAVKDPKGAVVKNATVAVINEAKNFQRSTTYNTEGEYPIRQLHPGTYKVTVEAPGFAKVVVKEMNLTVGQLAELPVTLQVATVAEVVNVTGQAELIETQRVSTTTTIEQERIDNLPINGRNYINFALTDSKLARDTAPSIGAAPTSGLNVGGQRARGNLVNVDGVDAVDNSTNGIRSTVSQEAVQEFQIITNGYNAEYGRASGGVVNIITRSGDNNFHGTMFGYLRNRNFQAVNPFSTESDPAYTRVQAGATAGGPIRKDKDFFFLSYETTRRQETGFSSIGANNFGLDPVPFNTATVGRPFGTITLAPGQADAIRALFAANPANPAITQYLVLAGGSSAVALNGRLTPGLAAAFGGAASVFPTSGFPLPASFVPLNNITGNFPISEQTSIASLRLDHKFNANQTGTVRLSYSPSDMNGIQVNAQGPQSFGQNAQSRTSEQNYHDFSVMGQHTWSLGANKVNDFRFQYARRGLRYDFSHSPGGSSVGVQIAGFAFLGREPFSFVNRTEQRYQWNDNFSWSRGTHNVKFGADVNHIPVKADFTVNFGGVYNVGSVTAIPGLPALSPIQAYGAGLPTALIQGVGNPHDEFSNKTLGVFLQDTWRIKPNFTLNYGVRYEVEFTPTFNAINAVSQAAQDAMGITQGIPRDTNNVAPRIGFAWDPFKDGKTVIRASYGIFYDHPLLGLAFDSDVADMTQAPQLILFGGSPGGCALNAANTFQGLLAPSVCPTIAGVANSNFNYLPNEQRFNPAPNAPSIFVNQGYLDKRVPLLLQPFGFPTGKGFKYAYANQASFAIERDLGHNMALSLEYNFNGGRHLNRPINLNATRPEQLLANFNRTVAAVNGVATQLTAAGVPAASVAAIKAAVLPSSALTAGICPTSFAGALLQNGIPAALVGALNFAPTGNYTPAPLVSFFRPSGLNPSALFDPRFTPCAGSANAIMTEFNFGTAAGLPAIPFSDLPANYSTGSSVYHGFTANLKKRFSQHYEFLMSYTWSHAIDDSTDLQSPLEPQDNFNLGAERSNSLFDQRHRFVLSSVYQSGKLGGQGFTSKIFSNWAIAPIVEIGSGRPFNIITFVDANNDLSVGTDRPRAVAAGTTSCGRTAVASGFSPTGFLIPACFEEGIFTGNIGRNAGRRPTTVFTDLRISKKIGLTERLSLDGIVDIFNLINRFNVADVNPLWNAAGTPTAAFDPRQFQFALKLSW